MNGVAEPQNSATQLSVTTVASASEQTLTASDLAMDMMTAEVTRLQHWPAWNYDRLSYRHSSLNFLTRNEVLDGKFLFVPMRLLTGDGDVTWSFFQAGYGKPFSRESAFLGKNRYQHDPQNVVYVKFSRAF